MRFMISSAAVLGVGGWAAMTMDPSAPDFDKVVPRPPAEVYAAFSDTATDGTTTIPGEGDMPSITVRVDKETGESISYRVLLGETEAVSVDLEFEPAGNGDSTRVTAELDIDQDEIRSLIRRAGGDTAHIPRIPNMLFDMAFRQQMEDLTDRVARGEPLGGIQETGFAAWQGISSGRADLDPGRSVAAERIAREARQDAAVRPMTTARPMMDPNASAQSYRGGS